MRVTVALRIHLANADLQLSIIVILLPFANTNKVDTELCSKYFSSNLNSHAAPAVVRFTVAFGLMA